MNLKVSVSNEWTLLNDSEKALINKFTSTYPVPIGAIIKSFGVTVLRSTLQTNISGEIREVDGKVIIRVNRHDVKTRQRFTLAHELAHFLLHKDLLSNGIVDDVLYRSAQSDYIEQQANRLAADIIMPIALIHTLCNDVEHEKDKGKRIEYIADKLDVSLTALKIRLNEI